MSLVEGPRTRLCITVFGFIQFYICRMDTKKSSFSLYELKSYVIPCETLGQFKLPFKTYRLWWIKEHDLNQTTL